MGLRRFNPVRGFAWRLQWARVVLDSAVRRAAASGGARDCGAVAQSYRHGKNPARNGAQPYGRRGAANFWENDEGG